MTNHIIIYSHGFGVEKTGRGLFTDITASFSDAKNIMFDYNQLDITSNTMTVTPLDKQAEMLTDIYNAERLSNPDAVIDVIAHSQGCVTAALARLNARHTILLAPPMQTLSSEDKVRSYIARRPGTIVKDGTTIMPRRDGSTTIISPDYWTAYDNARETTRLYNELSTVSKVTIIDAIEDEVLGERNYEDILSSISIVEVHANHNFTDDARPELISKIKDILKAP